MLSTFFGIELARRAIQTASYDMDVTGHNVSNASTDGYTEEVPQNTATDPYTVPMLDSNVMPGQIGTGVEVSQITRSSDSIINSQVRTSNSTLSYWKNVTNQLQQVQSAFQEPTSNGLQTAMDNFFGSWQTLSEDPTNMGARATVVSDAQTLVDQFHTSSTMLTQADANIQTQMQSDVTSINNIAGQINSLNTQIKNIIAQGQQPNDLEDSRGLLLNQLSQLAPLTTTENSDGTVNVYIYNNNPGSNPNLNELVAGNGTVNSVSLSLDTTNNIFNLTVNGSPQVNLSSPPSAYATSGGITGLEAARQKVDSYANQLDTLAYNLAQEVNTQHESGYDLYGNPGGLFFNSPGAVSGAAAGISISANISPNADGVEPNLNNIAAAATTTDPRDGTNALDMANLQNSTSVGLGSNTFDDYYQGLVTGVGSDVQNATQMQSSAQAANTQLVNMQQSVSGVSVDDQMTKLMQYQYAYQAAAQFFSVQNSILDTLINKMMG